MAHAFTDDNFQSDVLGADGLVLVDFYADWCGPCKMMAPVIEKLSGEHADVKIGKLDIEASQNTAMNYGVSSIPTLIFFKGGKEIDRVIGFQSKEALENKLAQLK